MKYMANDNLTKKDIREALGEVFDDKFDKSFSRNLEPFAKAVQEDFKNVRTEIQFVQTDLSKVQKNVRWMKDNASELFTKLDKFISLRASKA